MTAQDRRRLLTEARAHARAARQALDLLGIDGAALALAADALVDAISIHELRTAGLRPLPAPADTAAAQALERAIADHQGGC